MKYARRAGWEMVIYSFVLIILTLPFRWIGALMLNTAIVHFICVVITFIIYVVAAVCLFYGLWGLACGYNRNAWNNYIKTAKEETKRSVLKACWENNTEPLVGFDVLYILDKSEIVNGRFHRRTKGTNDKVFY